MPARPAPDRDEMSRGGWTRAGTAGAAISALVLLVAPAGARADAPARAATLAIAGALPRTGALSLADLQKLGPTKATWTSRGEQHQVTGVRLDKILVAFGFETGSMAKSTPKRQKMSGWRKVVVASAPDGFAAVLSCAEVSEGMGATQALIVWELDGKPLSVERGPFRLVVLTDKEPSRSVYSVSKLEVVDLAARAP
jgi:Oxidoreductase molybdopterin binding domain